jgi:hypothetical protein
MSWFSSVGVPTNGFCHDDYQRMCTANVVYDDDNSDRAYIVRWGKGKYVKMGIKKHSFAT